MKTRTTSLADVSIRWCKAACGFAFISFFTLTAAYGRGYSVLYQFQGGTDGEGPVGRLIIDKQGNLYGTTQYGGSNQSCDGYTGCGTVFKLAPDGTKTVLYAFTGGADGAFPRAGLTRDAAGNLFGTAAYGGGGGCDYGCGTVFRLAPDGTFMVLHAFTDSGDGGNPFGGLVKAGRGHYYGTASDESGHCYCGTVFRASNSGGFKALYAFTGGNDGGVPLGTLIEDAAENLYGVTLSGGLYEWGTVYTLAPDGTETVLHAFTDGGDGAWPVGGLITDDMGNFYGTTDAGGDSCGQNDWGCGTLFRLTPDGTFSVLYTFTGGNDGALPNGPLIVDAKGDFYGTTSQGGQCGNNLGGCGTIFKLAPDGTLQVLHTFAGANDGSYPAAGLLKGGDGYLYGTTSEGGVGSCSCGTVFRIKQ